MSEPKLRFKADDGSEFPKWEMKQFSSVADVYDGVHQTPHYQNFGIKFISVENITSIESTTKFISEEAFRRDFKVKAELGDIFMTRIGSIGKAALIKTNEALAYYVSLALIKCNTVEPTYLVYFIECKYFQKELWKHTLHEAYPKKINKGDIGLCKVLIPKSHMEQEKIADLFSSLDDVINQTQSEIDAWEKQKHGVMQLLFSWKVRFKADDGSEFPEWKYRKFDTLYTPVCEKNNGEYGVRDIISVANMYFKPDARVSNTGYLKTYNIFRLGDIAFEGNKSKRFSYGRFVENTIGDGIVSHVFTVFRPTETEHNLEYWKYAINNENVMGKILAKCTKKTTMMTNLVTKDFLAQKIFCPCPEEQQKIAACLSAFDDVIDKTKEEMAAYRELKKGLLQQMFV